MVRSRSGALYTGISTDVSRRFQEHETGKGARYLRGKGPLTLVFSKKVGSRSLASKIEREIKRFPKVRKEKLVSSGFEFEMLLRHINSGGKDSLNDES